MTLAITYRNKLWCGLIRHACWKHRAGSGLLKKNRYTVCKQVGIKLLLPALCWRQGRVCGARSDVQDGWSPGYGSLKDAVLAEHSGIWMNYLPELWSGSCPVRALWAGEVPLIHPRAWFHYLRKEGLIKTTAEWLQLSYRLRNLNIKKIAF